MPGRWMMSGQLFSLYNIQKCAILMLVVLIGDQNDQFLATWMMMVLLALQ
jgi:hypothetical protein